MRRGEAGRGGNKVTQKSVEIFIGKLASDEELRDRFRQDRRAAIDKLQSEGLELTALEIESLVAADADAFDRLADALDPRLQKASLHPAQPGRKAEKP
jgi:hypothetical protein